MKLALLLVTALGCATGSTAARPARAVDPATARREVRQAEIAFATAFRNRDRRAFFAMIADDAVFLGPHRTLRGKRQVLGVWDRFFAAPAAPFSWVPERVEISGDGSLGLSTGPVRDPSGMQIASFSSIWRRQADGSWRVIFDGPGCPAPASFEFKP